MIVTVAPCKIFNANAAPTKQVVLQNQNAPAGPNLFFGSKANTLLQDGTLVAPGGATPQLTINEDLWVRGDVGNVQLRIIFT